jgi:Protein of unknown function (DUF3168)
MTYPAENLQRALYEKITGDAALEAVMGGEVRAYDRVPENHVFPYITIGDVEFIDDSDGCEANRYEAFAVLQAWSRAVGNIECKKIAGELRNAVLNGFAIPGWLVKVNHCQSIFHSTDPDGVTSRARVKFRFIVEPA